MPPLFVTSDAPAAGRTTVAAALARLLAEGGRSVWLARLGGDASAGADAATFAAVPGVRSPGDSVAAADLASAPSDAAIIVEAPAGAPADIPGASRLLVTTAAAAPSQPPAGVAGVVVTFVPPPQTDGVKQRLAGLPLLAALPEDRLLAAPTVAAIASALQARRLYGQDGLEEAVEHLLVGTVASDPGTPYFRRGGRTGVVTRFDKVDVILAAMFTDVSCLVLTGGYEPVEYVLDRLNNEGPHLTLLLSDGTTVEAMRTLAGLYGRTPFAGARKLERAVDLLRPQLSLADLPL